MAEKKPNYLYIGVIVVLLAVIGYLLFQDNLSAVPAENPAVEKVRNVYSLLTERDVAVVRVSEESGVYRVLLQLTLRNGQQSLQEVLVTKDGMFMTDRVINSTGFTEQLNREKDFAECLVQERVAVAGLANDANTLAQLQTLGNFAYKVFVDCSDANLQLCQNAGITQVPTTIFGEANQSVVGVQPLSVFQDATGCSL